jgi:GDP-4-dehydro-6-deoxy-D-mannose reductase
MRGDIEMKAAGEDSCRATSVTVLITGGGGFVGRHLIEYLIQETDWQIVGFGRTPPGQEHPRYRFYFGDICEQDAIRQALAVSRPDYVFHLAAATPPAPDALMYAVNVGGTANLLEAVQGVNPRARVLVVGSDAQYGPLPPRHVPTSERAPMRPVGPYGRSKVLQERIARQFQTMLSLPIVCVRPFNHIGPGQSDRFVVPSIARQIAEAEAGLTSGVIQLGRIDTARDFTDVRDVVRAYLDCMRDGEVGGVYNVGSGQPYRIAEIADLLAAAAAVPVTFTSVTARARPGDVLRTQCDASVLHRRTAWAPRIPIEKTLTDTLDYWRAQVRRERLPHEAASVVGGV